MAVITWEAHIDWLTATYPLDAGIETNVSIAKAIRDELNHRRELVERKNWAWQGYTGESFNGICRGVRHDGRIVKVSGERAHGVIKRLPKDGMKCTRLDLAVTLWFTQDDPSRARREHVKAMGYREEKHKGRPYKIRLEDGTGDGDTLYIGSRSSASYGRLYDKGRETLQQEFATAWRWEVEFKEEAAAHIGIVLARYNYSPINIAATVQKWFDGRGVSLPLDVGGVQAIEAPKEKHTSDDERRLTWLTTHVQPTVQRLIDTVGRDAVLLALGLSE